MTSPPHRTAVTRRTLLRAGGWTAATLGAGGTILTGCARSDPNALSFWHFTASGSPAADWLDNLVDTWNAENQVQVRQRFIPFSDYANGPSLQTAFSSDAGPDVFVLSPGDFIRYRNADVLVDLTDRLTDSVRDDYLPGTLDSRTFDGRVYGLPMESEPLALFYGHEAFESAGLSEADVPATWDDFLDVAEKLTSADRFGVVLETNPGYYQNFTWYPFLWMGGGSPISDDQRHATFDGDAAEAALRLWGETVARGTAPTLPKGSGGGDSIANLSSGYCGMQQTGVWALGELATSAPDFAFGAAPLPLPPGGERVTTAGGWALCANARGANPEAAADFITWALGTDDPDCLERGRQWNTIIKKNLPVRRSVTELATAEGDIDSPEYQMFVDEIAPTAVGEPRYPVEIYRGISDAIQACQLDGADPATAAADANTQIETFLSSYQGAPIL